MTKGKQGIKNSRDEELVDIEDEMVDDVVLVRTLRHLRWYGSELQEGEDD